MYDFFILSRIENGIFVYHNIDDAISHDKGISYFLYNVLKNINIIDNDEVNIFIYEHNFIKKTCELIILQNKNKGDLEDFDKENLENIFNEIIKNINSSNDSTNNMFVVSYENKNFTTSFAPFTFNSEEPIVLDTIEYIAI
jgi:hypothetical protein